MIHLFKKPFYLIAFVVSSSVITAFMAAYRWLSGVFNVKDLGIIIAMFAVLFFMVFIIMNLKTIKPPKNYTLDEFRAKYPNMSISSLRLLLSEKPWALEVAGSNPADPTDLRTKIPDKTITSNPDTCIIHVSYTQYHNYLENIKRSLRDNTIKTY